MWSWAKNKISRLSIGAKFILCFVILLIIPFAVMLVYLFNVTTQSVHEQSSQVLENHLSQIGSSIDEKVSTIERAVQIVATDSTLQNTFGAFYSNEEDRLINYQFKSSPFVYNIIVQTRDANAIYMYNEDFVVCEMTDSFFSIRRKQSPALFEAMGFGYERGETKEGWVLTHSGPVNIVRPALSPKYALSFKQKVFVATQLKEVAMVEMVVDEEVLFSDVYRGRLEWMGHLFIVDESGRVISNNEAGDYLKTIEEFGFAEYKCGGYFNQIVENNMIISKPIKGLSANIVSIVPVQNISGQVRERMLRIALLAFALIIFSFIAVSIITKMLLRRVSYMIDAMALVRNGDLSVQLSVEPMDEIGKLSENFNYMIKALEKSMKDVYQAGLMEREAELHALEAQINPHFLFNTLATITWIGRAQGSQEIVETTEALARFYRIVLSNGVSVIYLYEEIQIVKSYLQIQKVRFENRFSIEYDIEPEAESFRIIKNILQPLVENALGHGIDPKTEPGKIRLQVSIKNKNLHILLSDDGVGMTQERRLQVLGGEVKKKKRGGYALYNIIKRLDVFYGKNYEFVIQSQVGQGTTVHIVLPPIKAVIGGDEDVQASDR